ncbi:WD40 repeat domain-containing protein [Paludisphaera soli]|uniref:WD40 repeat domain-containing protein n=1 Tax=Paludisphaera soli TaxID=2712865 RepID=UPI0013EC7911|nr:PD40 domain-containing protein [Paludisphaera soli]
MKTSRRMRFAVGVFAVLLLGRVAFLGAVGPRPAATLRGSHVFQIAFSPDGRTLASTDVDRAINLWDVDGRRVRAVLEGHDAFVDWIRFSPDGETLASSTSREGEGRNLWDVANGTLIRETTRAEAPDWAREPPSERMQSGRVGARLAQSDGLGHFRAVELLDVATGEVIASLAGHRDQVNAVAFSPDGALAATGGGSLDHPWPVNRAGDARLWSVKTGNLLAVLGGHWGPVSDVAFSPDGAILATASYDGSIKLWSVAKLVRGVAY